MKKTKNKKPRKFNTVTDRLQIMDYSDRQWTIYKSLVRFLLNKQMFYQNFKISIVLLTERTIFERNKKNKYWLNETNNFFERAFQKTLVF